MSAIHQPRLLCPDHFQSVLRSLGVTYRVSSYDPFGYRGCSHGGIAFNGQLSETNTDHYLLGHGYRVYDPVLRRFLRPDLLCPFGPGGLNSYGYCQGDPINATDPTGRFPWAPAGLVTLGIGAMVAGYFTVRTAKPEANTESGEVGGVEALGWGGILIGFGMALTIGGAVLLKQPVMDRARRAIARSRAGAAGSATAPASGIQEGVNRDSMVDVDGLPSYEQAIAAHTAPVAIPMQTFRISASPNPRDDVGLIRSRHSGPRTIV